MAKGQCYFERQFCHSLTFLTQALLSSMSRWLSKGSSPSSSLNNLNVSSSTIQKPFSYKFEEFGSACIQIKTTLPKINMN